MACPCRVRPSMHHLCHIARLHRWLQVEGQTCSRLRSRHGALPPAPCPPSALRLQPQLLHFTRSLPFPLPAAVLVRGIAFVRRFHRPLHRPPPPHTCGSCSRAVRCQLARRGMGRNCSVGCVPPRCFVSLTLLSFEQCEIVIALLTAPAPFAVTACLQRACAAPSPAAPWERCCQTTRPRSLVWPSL